MESYLGWYAKPKTKWIKSYSINLSLLKPSQMQQHLVTYDCFRDHHYDHHQGTARKCEWCTWISTVSKYYYSPFSLFFRFFFLIIWSPLIALFSDNKISGQHKETKITGFHSGLITSRNLELVQSFRNDQDVSNKIVRPVTDCISSAMWN